MLKTLIELEYGLQDELVSNQVIDIEVLKGFEIDTTCLKQRERLLDTLLFKLSIDRHQFIKCLISSDQRHLAMFIQYNGRK